VTRRGDELSAVRYQLVLGGEAAARLANHLEDLHGEAFLRHVGDHERVDSGGGHPGLDGVGDPRARRLWRRIVAAGVTLEAMPVLERAILNLFMAGPGADAGDYRGTLIAKSEYVQRIRNQRKQAAAGEHVPPRLVDQPPYPGAGR